MSTPPDLSRLKIDRGMPQLTSRRRRRWIVWALLALIGGGIGTWFALQPRPVAVQITPIVTTFPSQQYVLLNASGYVVAQRKAAISTKATGRLEWLGVAEGSRVKQGEIIARLDNRDVAAQAETAAANVTAARAALEQALAEERDALAQLKRTQDLVAQNFVAAASLDTARARADKATASVSNARAMIASAQAAARNAQVAVDYTVIRAPFDGVILSKSANVGDMVTPFSNATDSKGAVVNIADMSTLEVEADVAESSLSKIQAGQPAEILLDALPDARFRGRISRMVPTVDRAKATVMTKVKFDAIDPRILPDMSAKVSFLSQDVTAQQQKPLLAVSTDAIVNRDGRTVVLAVRDGRAIAVPVTTGIKVGDLTAITGEINSGDKVVGKPDDKIVTGVLVKAAAK